MSDEERLLSLRALVAQLEWANTSAANDVAKFGSFSRDYNQWRGEIWQDILRLSPELKGLHEESEERHREQDAADDGRPPRV